ncbi:G-type lectin S-receptor-like serine/threonine-protein kinase At1g11330 [Henckelia pumila]|uniref:G-type lectin S-receptor-like serine/threonine-protein kinase At1g11330 n=1 Tax=Henckelia pumila TaxID=405737 RepID=UPI003C6E3380
MCTRRKREEEVQELLTLEGYTDTYEDRGAKGHDLRLFTYASILAATDNFSYKNKLGEGGFGPVYKGVTPEGHHIAVKVLSRSSGQGLLEFKNELILILKLQHVNLVKLIGFSIHGNDKIIVYDYMPNKSLDCFLFDSSKRGLLDWLKRFTIIEGIAQGLLYLHKYSRLTIVHRDLKSGNILLDEDMTPKIFDFGLARIFKQSTSEANTERRVGTYGYMAPEYAMQGIFSLKSDVYSFGVLVLEIVSGRKNNSFHDIQGPLNLVEHAWELWSNDSAVELMDPTLRGSCNIQQLLRCIHIGLLCVENRAVDRPSIEDVISMLKNEMKDTPMPKNPAFITRDSVIELNKKISLQNNYSVNEISLTQTEQGR